MSKVPCVKDLMQTSLVTLNPDMDIFQAISILLRHRISGAPVVDEGMKLVGMLSEKDCLRIFVSGAFNQLPGAHVHDYMTKDPVTLSPDDDLFNVVSVFLSKPFRRLPVLEDGKLVGQVSRRDVLDGTRKIWEAPPEDKQQWTDSKYIPEQIQAILKMRTTR